MKRIVIITSSIFITIFVGVLFINHINTNIKISDEQWALNNNGQIINEVKGTKGIDINIKKAWEITTGHPDVLVAVVDSGVDTSCEGIKDSIYADGLKCFDFYNNDNTVYDSYFEDYHGTYITNIIAGYDTKNNVYGVAPNISILPIKFLSGTQGNSADSIKAVEYACKQGAKIVNCSWDFNEYNQELYDIIASYPNVLFVCAAGNSNLDLDKISIYPACYDLKNIITVLAVNNNGEIYGSSGYGGKVDVAAPGVDIITVFPEDDVTYVSGTSIATAYVSGIAALMISENSSISPNEIIDIMVRTSKELKVLNGKCLAEGIIDAYECVKEVKD